MRQFCGLPVLMTMAIMGCNGARPAGDAGAGTASGRPPVVRHDPQLETQLKGLEHTGTVRHVVTKGETLYAISRTYSVPVTAIVAANPGLKLDLLKVGQELTIPGAAAPAAVPEAATGARLEDVKTPDRGRLRYPVAGRYRASQGGTVGVDFQVPAGTVVVAAAEGKVAVSTPSFGTLGPTVMVEHAGGMVTLYGGLRDVAVKPGQVVRRGGSMGRTGDGGLVFRVYQGSAPVNPAPLLQ
jgi:murein DD-endopeptidase MepM/ murein hydrolase activator NlpD